MVSDHTAQDVWGEGDEPFPVAALEQAGSWIVYYLPNGTPQAREIGVAWGAKPERLERTAGVPRERENPLGAWGTAGIVRFEEQRFVLFTTCVGEAGPRQAWWLSSNAPSGVGKPLAEYRFDDLAQGTVVLGHEGPRSEPVRPEPAAGKAAAPDQPAAPGSAALR